MNKFQLKSSEIKKYYVDGFLSPIDILSSEEIKVIQEEINLIENNWPDQIIGLNRNNIHYYSPVIDHLVHNIKILDIIENFIGSNILIAGTCLFLKEPQNKGFISWHQDGLYQGWEPLNSLTAWIAITEVNEENGCMKMWPGSHKGNFKKHKDTFDKNNLLTRGQTIEDVPDSETVPIILKPGQLSLHHPMTVHGSGPNLSSKRRIGLAVQSYIGTNVKQNSGKTLVQLARGEDEYKYHQHTSRPKKRMENKDIILRNHANLELQKILYKDSKIVGKY